MSATCAQRFSRRDNAADRRRRPLRPDRLLRPSAHTGDRRAYGGEKDAMRPTARPEATRVRARLRKSATTCDRCAPSAACCAAISTASRPTTRSRSTLSASCCCSVQDSRHGCHRTAAPPSGPARPCAPSSIAPATARSIPISNRQRGSRSKVGMSPRANRYPESRGLHAAFGQPWERG